MYSWIRWSFLSLLISLSPRFNPISQIVAKLVIDAVRCAKLALDRGQSGALIEPSAYLMKSPPRQFPDDEAHKRIEEFIVGEQVRISE